jgi:hypothetical protein
MRCKRASVASSLRAVSGKDWKVMAVTIYVTGNYSIAIKNKKLMRPLRF